MGIRITDSPRELTGGIFCIIIFHITLITLACYELQSYLAERILYK